MSEKTYLEHQVAATCGALTKYGICEKDWCKTCPIRNGGTSTDNNTKS